MGKVIGVVHVEEVVAVDFNEDMEEDDDEEGREHLEWEISKRVFAASLA